MKLLKYTTAKELGLVIDTFVYPHIGYLGSRFNPSFSISVLTELEEKAIDAVMDISFSLAKEANQGDVAQTTLLQCLVSQSGVMAMFELANVDEVKEQVRIAKGKLQ